MHDLDRYLHDVLHQVNRQGSYYIRAKQNVLAAVSKIPIYCLFTTHFAVLLLAFLIREVWGELKLNESGKTRTM